MTESQPVPEPSDQHNPYAVPATEARTLSRRQQSTKQARLASLGARLGGFMIDGVLPTIVAAFGLVAFLPVAVSGSGSRPEYFTSGMLVVMGLIGLFSIGILIVNLYLIATRAQTIGKLVAGTQIANPDGTPASLGRIVALRWIVCSLIAGAAAFIPAGGILYFLVDSLLVFREDRRCLHDLIAGTIVIEYRRRR